MPELHPCYAYVAYMGGGICMHGGAGTAPMLCVCVPFGYNTLYMCVPGMRMCGMWVEQSIASQTNFELALRIPVIIKVGVIVGLPQILGLPQPVSSSSMWPQEFGTGVPQDHMIYV